MIDYLIRLAPSPLGRATYALRTAHLHHYPPPTYISSRSPPSLNYYPRLRTLFAIPRVIQLRPCHLHLALPLSERVLVPCVAPDHHEGTLEEVFPGVRPSIAAALQAVRDLRAADPDLAVAVEVVGATGAQVTAERPVRRVPQGAQK